MNFLLRLALQKKKKTWWQLACPCCWNRARRLTCFLSVPVTRKDLQFGTWTDHSFQRHYRFRPTTSGSRSGQGLISTFSYKGLTNISATASDALVKEDRTVLLGNVRVLGQSLTWEADSRSACIGIPRLLLSPNVYYRSHDSVPPASLQCHWNPVHTLMLCDTSSSISSSLTNRFGVLRSDDPYTFYYCHLNLRTNQTARDASTVTFLFIYFFIFFLFFFLLFFFIPPCGKPHNASKGKRRQASYTASQTSISNRFSCWTPRINKLHRKTFAGSTPTSSHRILCQPATG